MDALLFVPVAIAISLTPGPTTFAASTTAFAQAWVLR